MNRYVSSLRTHTHQQLRALCEVVGIDAGETPFSLLSAVIGAADDGRGTDRPHWPSDVADDGTPVEFSIAFDRHGNAALRILCDTIAAHPSRENNRDRALELLESWADGFHISRRRLDAVADLFLPTRPMDDFVLWYSLIFRPNCPPSFKVYLNPNIRGAERAGDLVANALCRLGLGLAYRTTLRYALRRDGHDRLSFFAIDLHAQAGARVKVYVSHHAAEAADVRCAAAATPGIDPTEIGEFCRLAGGRTGPFTGRPLLSSYSFLPGDTDRPSSYTLYLPIRDYVDDDAAARSRVRRLMDRYRLDLDVLDRALAAVSHRPLRDGVGMIAHVSLQLGSAGNGFTVYLSAEAYGTAPPRIHRMPAQSRRAVVGGRERQPHPASPQPANLEDQPCP